MLVADSLIRTGMRLTAARMRRRGPSGPAAIDDPPIGAAVRQAQGILVVALAELGDMVLLSPFVRELRSLAPAARITLVTLPAGAALFERCDLVDEVIPFAAAMPRLLRPLFLPCRARGFALRLRSGRHFDLAIVPRWDTDHHLASAVAWFSGADRRVGYSETVHDRKRTLNAGFDSLFTDVVRSARGHHEVERHMALITALGGTPSSDLLQLWLSEADRLRPAELLSAAKVAADTPIVALGIGAAHPKRRWPVDRYVALGRALQARHGALVVVVGGVEDVEAQAAVLAGVGARALGCAGMLSLRETAALLERCDLFVGNDSAPLHLAAAAAIPCVEISCHPAGGDALHNNSPARFRPWGVDHLVLRPTDARRPCGASCTATRPHCILKVSSGAALEASARLLARVSPPPTGATSR